MLPRMLAEGNFLIVGLVVLGAITYGEDDTLGESLVRESYVGGGFF